MVKWKKARKKPVIVDFRDVKKIPITIDNHQIFDVNGKQCFGEVIETMEGVLMADADEDFIIRGVRGELYPIKKSIFYETYDVLESPYDYYKRTIKDRVDDGLREKL